MFRDFNKKTTKPIFLAEEDVEQISILMTRFAIKVGGHLTVKAVKKKFSDENRNFATRVGFFGFYLRMGKKMASQEAADCGA